MVAAMPVDLVGKNFFSKKAARAAELAGHVSSWASASWRLASAPVRANMVDNVRVATMLAELVDKTTVSKRLRGRLTNGTCKLVTVSKLAP